MPECNFGEIDSQSTFFSNPRNVYKENYSKLESEKGTLEAGLVIIPTTLLFLMILQILFAGSWQIMERAQLHNLVIKSSLLDTAQDAHKASETSHNGPNLRALVNNSFPTNAKITVEEKQTDYGQIQRVELVTPIPIFQSLLKFFGVNEIVTKNVAVLIAN